MYLLYYPERNISIDLPLRLSKTQRNGPNISIHDPFLAPMEKKEKKNRKKEILGKRKSFLFFPVFRDLYQKPEFMVFEVVASEPAQPSSAG